MICPRCKQGEMFYQETYTGVIFNRKKLITYFCAVCPFQNIKTFKINEDCYQQGILDLSVKKHETC